MKKAVSKIKYALIVSCLVILAASPVQAKTTSPEDIDNNITNGKDEFGHDMSYSVKPTNMPNGNLAKINKTNYKDAALYKYIKSLDKDKDNYISTSEIKKHTGFIKVKGKTFYINKETALPKIGYTKIGKNNYYFTIKGIMKTGKVKYNKKYLMFNSSGKQIKNKMTIYKGNKYYVGKNGVIKTGWFIYKGRKYYANNTGKIISNKTIIY